MTKKTIHLAIWFRYLNWEDDTEFVPICNFSNSIVGDNFTESGRFVTCKKCDIYCYNTEKSKKLGAKRDKEWEKVMWQYTTLEY